MASNRMKSTPAQFRENTQPAPWSEMTSILKLLDAKIHSHQPQITPHTLKVTREMPEERNRQAETTTT
jgi:hypothetical protein